MRAVAMKPHVAEEVLLRQSAAVRAMGSTFVASVLAAGARGLAYAPHTTALIEGWTGDAAADALAMRFNGALHALARRQTIPALTMLYRQLSGDFDAVIGAAMAAADDVIAAWMRNIPQTNEVGRSAGIMAALLMLRGRYDMPCALYELGASAGLNLSLDRYSYDLGGRRIGRSGSPVHIAPAWRGSAPDARPVDIVSARGVDLHPIDLEDGEACERLMAYVWADEPDRAERLETALAIARNAAPCVERGDIARWLPAQLSAPQAIGTCRTVIHSMALQYLGAVDRRAVEVAFEEAGARASASRPLARIGFEWTSDRDAVHLSLTTWPDGRTQHLANCHAYGAWFDWHDMTGDAHER